MEDAKDLVYRLRAEMCSSWARAEEGQLEAGGLGPQPTAAPSALPRCSSLSFHRAGPAFTVKGKLTASPESLQSLSGSHEVLG